MHKAEAATPAPVSYNYTGWQPGSNDLSLDDPLVAMAVDKSTPEQIRLTLGANVDTILVVWTTGAGFNFSETYETPSTPLQTKVPRLCRCIESVRVSVLSAIVSTIVRVFSNFALHFSKKGPIVQAGGC